MSPTLVPEALELDGAGRTCWHRAETESGLLKAQQMAEPHTWSHFPHHIPTTRTEGTKLGPHKQVFLPSQLLLTFTVSSSSWDTGWSGPAICLPGPPSAPSGSGPALGPSQERGAVSWVLLSSQHVCIRDSCPRGLSLVCFLPHPCGIGGDTLRAGVVFRPPPPHTHLIEMSPHCLFLLPSARTFPIPETPNCL